jgi:hypothetical protein
MNTEEELLQLIGANQWVASAEYVPVEFGKEDNEASTTFWSCFNKDEPFEFGAVEEVVAKTPARPGLPHLAATLETL